MGRITIFTTEKCPFGRQVEVALEQRNIPYSTISLSQHPEKRTDMFMLTQRMSTPQVFFNTRHVGGCDETLKCLSKWDKDRHHKTAHDMYLKIIATSPDPSNPRLQIPEVTNSGDAPPAEPTALHPKTILLPLPSGEQRVSLAETTELLCKILPLAGLRYNLTCYKNSITGTDAVAALMKHYDCDEKQATEIGKVLLKNNMLHHVCYDHDFLESDKLFYRLQCHQTPHVLNSYYCLADSLDDDVQHAEKLVVELEQMVDKLESDCLSDDGRIHYERASSHKDFPALQSAFCALQGISPDLMDAKTLLAFKLNVYVVLMRFAFMKHGVPTTEADQIAFCQSVKFYIGTDTFSFHEWVRADLSGRKRPGRTMSLFSSDKGKKRVRRTTSMSSSNKRKSEHIDIRVLFAIHYFWTHASAIEHFTAENLDRELTVMAMAFCEDDNNVLVNTKKEEVHLSRIFGWYRKDFLRESTEKGDEGLVELIFGFVEGNKKLELQRVLYNTDRKMKICIHEDDWAFNVAAPENAKFNAASINANSVRNKK